jgi:hypothetical protein
LRQISYYASPFYKIYLNFIQKGYLNGKSGSELGRVNKPL